VRVLAGQSISFAESLKDCFCLLALADVRKHGQPEAGGDCFIHEFESPIWSGRQGELAHIQMPPTMSELVGECSRHGTYVHNSTSFPKSVAIRGDAPAYEKAAAATYPLRSQSGPHDSDSQYARVDQDGVVEVTPLSSSFVSTPATASTE